jgi:TolA-binding protein
MTSSAHCIEDLIVRARRGELLPDEQRQLHMAVAASREARLLLDAGIGFDAESPVLPGDDDLVARMADQLAAAGRPSESRRRWRGALLLAATAFVATTAAAGGWYGLRRVFTAESSTGHVERGTPRPLPRAPVAARPAPPLAAPPASGAQRSTRIAPPPAPSLSAPTTETSGELFARANRARREGRAAEATILYLELGSRYPGSPEARQADLTLGELYLQAADGGAALECFRRYRGRAMAAEALWGEARALRLLGRTAEERQALTALATEFPASAYADAARKRLGRTED